MESPSGKHSARVRRPDEIAPDSLMVSRLLAKVKALPEIREEVVRELQVEVDSGGYPRPLQLERLAQRIGEALIAGEKVSSGLA